MRWLRNRSDRRANDAIVSMTPGYVQVRVDGRLARIWGERFARGYGSPDFLASHKQVSWEDGGRLTEDDHERILQVLRESARERRQDVEIE
jgi:immunity protein 74 of polymorphic toxin system